MTAPYGILIDTTRCTGCEDCVKACKEENDLGKDMPRRWKRRIDDLSSTRYTTLIEKPGSRFVRQMCRHCNEPACASACIVGALQKTPEGSVIYDAEKCMGCRYCMMSCPFGIPRYEWEKSAPRIRKCTFCYSRIAKGDKPACVTACTYEATLFGRRDALIEEAQKRLDASRDRYLQRIVGESDVGGTAILYISDIPLDFLAWRSGLETAPLQERTRDVLYKVPPLVLGMGGLLAGVHWITARRAKVASASRSSEKPAEPSEGGSPEDGENS